MDEFAGIELPSDPQASTRGAAAGLVSDPGGANGAQVGARRPGLTEDEYVAQELVVTLAYIERGASNVKVKGRYRLARSEAYARWRYQAFCRGEVARL